jgi:hypothetical protein
MSKTQYMVTWEFLDVDDEWKSALEKFFDPEKASMCQAGLQANMDCDYQIRNVCLWKVEELV